MRPPLRPSCIKILLPPLHRLLRTPPQSQVPRRRVTTSTTNTALIDVPKLVVSPGSKHHNSLPSFLEYTERNRINTKSTVYVGTLYEYRSALALLRLGFSLLRTGRRSDAGIDLIGHWVLPPLREPLPVIVQCKGTASPITPSIIRELEGSFQNIPHEWRRKDVLGLICSAHNATSGTLHAISTSQRPLGYVKITQEGSVKQLLWNHAASERGLEGVGVTIRHTPCVLLPPPADWGAEDTLSKKSRDRPNRPRALRKFRAEGTHKDVQLTWLGSPISPAREDLAPQTTELIQGLEDEKDGQAENCSRARKKNETTLRKPKITKPPKKPTYSANGRRLGRPPGIKNGEGAGPQITPSTPRPKTGARGGQLGRPPGGKNVGKKKTEDSPSTRMKKVKGADG